MSDPKDLPVKTLQFYTTAEYPCSYLPERAARSQVAAPTHLIDTGVYGDLVQQGFRRSGLFTYRPHCDRCNACLPIRIDVARFEPNRTQRRTWARQPELKVRITGLHWDEEHFALYQRYQLTRHPGAGMDDDMPSQYRQFLLTSRVDTRLVEFRNAQGELQMVSVIDILSDGLSAVYTFFDPDAPGSLGTWAILWQIEACRNARLPWLYLGYWIQESRKMTYKSAFRPHQILRAGTWVEAQP
ncbi:arginyltransferase [Yanghanlia caeni]|uniref:Aspartate/glutamate leucyltransferase n=1 Tax=Yanghanlia caeni TaxID=3064283 RepID=A0ABU1D9M0_9BURK|nr:arginyltransferase [Alcaligenaceae bacterium LG-2]NGR09200.1 arginyltransferase [bacterium SGD-2]HZH57788.1 arginyltransferase [Burkholderiaceae bacterium]